jgi:hypothetical protein
MERTQEETSKDFSICKDTLRYPSISSLFDLDNIRDSKSQKSFDELHGVQGIISALRTSISHGISTNPTEIKQRAQ